MIKPLLALAAIPNSKFGSLEISAFVRIICMIDVLNQPPSPAFPQIQVQIWGKGQRRGDSESKPPPNIPYLDIWGRWEGVECGQKVISPTKIALVHRKMAQALSCR